MAGFVKFENPKKIGRYVVYAAKAEPKNIKEEIPQVNETNLSGQNQTSASSRLVDVPGYRLTYKIHYHPMDFEKIKLHGEPQKPSFLKEVLSSPDVGLSAAIYPGAPNRYLDKYIEHILPSLVSTVESLAHDVKLVNSRQDVADSLTVMHQAVEGGTKTTHVYVLDSAQEDVIEDLTFTLVIDAVHPAVAFPNLTDKDPSIEIRTAAFQKTLAKITLQENNLPPDSQTHLRDALKFVGGSTAFPRLRFTSSIAENFTYDSESNQFFVPSYYLNGISSEQEFREFVAENYLISDVLDRQTPQEFLEGRETPEEKAAREKQEQEDFRRYVRDIKVTEQALLLNNLKYFSDLSIKIRKERPYNNFACIDAKAPKGTNGSNNSISDFVTMLTAQRGMTPIIDQLRPIHLASMIPVVRFYGYENDEKDDLFEYEFEEFLNINDGRSNDILGTSKGVGLVSFSWNLHGENYYLADKEIKCQMVIRAQSVDDLVHQRNSANGKDYKFSQIFIPVDPTGTQATTGGTDVKARVMRTRAKIAYKIDESSPVWAGYDELRDAIKRMTFELELALSMHSIDLNQDGTMRITVDFIGRFDEESKDYRHANILSEDYIEEVKKGKTERLKSLKKRREKLQKAVTDTSGQFDTISTTNDIASMQKQLQELQREINEAIQDTTGFDRKRAALTLMERMYRRRGLRLTRIDGLSLSPVETSASPVEPTPARDIANGTSATTKDVNDAAGQDVRSTIAEFAKEIQDICDEKPLYYVKYVFLGEIVESAIEAYIENANLFQTFANGKPNLTPHLRDTRIVLGPIEYKTNSYDASEIKEYQITYSSLLLNPCSSGTKKRINELKKLQNEASENRPFTEDEKKELKELEEVSKTEQQTVVCNLADLPISLTSLHEWVAEHIVEAGKTRYTLNEFVKELINDLVPKALTTDSENLVVPRVNSKIRNVLYSARTESRHPFKDKLGFEIGKEKIKVGNTEKEARHEAPLWFPGEDSKDKVAYIEDLKNLPLGEEPTGNDEPTHMADYLLIYGEQLDYKRKFNKTSDHNLGIYHLEAGKDAGIVKEIRLSVTDDKEYHTLATVNALTGNDPSNARKRVYNATIELQGSTFFRPGQLVFVNPAAYGRIENLKSFGLIGYFTVIRVNHDITDGRYNTSLDCIFHAWSNSGGSN